MFCTNCGKEIPENVKFCNYCGARQGFTAAGASSQPTKQQSNNPYASQERPPQQNYVPRQPIPTQKSGNGLKIAGITLLILAVLAVFAVIGVRFIRHQDDRPQVSQQPASPDDFVIENGILTNYMGAGGDVVIPDGVTGIGGLAFMDRTWVTGVTIPDSVTSIGNSAFFGCDGMSGVTIPDSVASIGENTFAYCYGFTSVVIPDSVTSIGQKAFLDCTNLEDVTIPGGATIGKDAFFNCTKLKNVNYGGTEADWAACGGVNSGLPDSAVIHFNGS